MFARNLLTRFSCADLISVCSTELEATSSDNISLLLAVLDLSSLSASLTLLGGKG